MSGYRHVVLFRFRDPADTAAHRRAVELLTGLRCCPGVLSWRLAWSEDRRKGPVLVEDVLFGDRPAFDAWRDSPAHRRAAAFLSGAADWLAGDLAG